MRIFRPRRSALYVPGAKLRAIDRSREINADVLVFDLEDSATPEQKDNARENVCAAISRGGYGEREIVIRINPLATPWGEEDLMAAVSSGADGILVPKISSAEDVLMVARVLSTCDGASNVEIWAMIETSRALLHIGDIASIVEEADVPLTCLVLGTNDLVKETRIKLTDGRGPLAHWISMVVLAARAHGLDVLDGVYNKFRDMEGFLDECKKALELGMDGKTLIHPSQTELANELFCPSPSEINQARRVISAFELPENIDAGVINLDGEMVERLHLEMAHRTLTISEVIAVLDNQS